MRKSPVVHAFGEQRAATISRLARLDPDDWQRPCLPGWTVHDVVAHLVSIDEAAARGRLVPVLLRSPDRPAIERWNDAAVLALRGRTPGELMAALAHWGRRLHRIARAVPSVVAQARVPSPFGRQPVMFLLYRRVLDEWVHEHDVAAAMDGEDPLPALPGPRVADVLASAVLAAFPELVLPALVRSVGVVRLVVDRYPEGVGGGSVRRTWAVDLARRQYGPRVGGEPDAVVHTSAPVLALIAEGRLRPGDAVAPLLSITGDRDLAHGFLDAVPPAPGPGA